MEVLNINNIFFKDDRQGLSGYDLMQDNEGIKWFIDRSTGEVKKAVNQFIPEGSITYTPQSQTNYKKKEENNKKKFLSRMQSDELGHFYFAEIKDRTNELSPQSLGRLMFLATFLRYDSNILYQTQRTPLKKNVLQDIMHLNKKAFYNFWDEVYGTFLFEDNKKNLVIDNSFFRGSLTNKLKKTIDTNGYQKIYIDALRELYYKLSVTQHRYLGCIFSLLPYINWEFNVLCTNPQEKCFERLNVITLNGLSKILGYNKSQRDKFYQTCREIIFEFNNKKQRFCSFVVDDTQVINESPIDFNIFINPHILYRGSNYKQVEVLGLFFKDI